MTRDDGRTQARPAGAATPQLRRVVGHRGGRPLSKKPSRGQAELASASTVRRIRKQVRVSMLPTAAPQFELSLCEAVLW